MGNAKSCHASLIKWRPGRAVKVRPVVKSLRTNYLLDRDMFTQGWGQAGNSPGQALFSALDTDQDGFVDVFEVVALLSLYSSSLWREKSDMLFDAFDFNSKGFLRAEELEFLVWTIIRALRKFVSELDEDTETNWKKDIIGASFSSDELYEWFLQNSLGKALRCFIDDELSKDNSEHVPPSRLWRSVLALETAYEAQQQNLTQLQGDLAEVKSALSKFEYDDSVASTTRRKRDEYLMENVNNVMMKIQTSVSTQGVDIGELASLENTVEMDTRVRMRQEQIISDIEAIQKQTERDIASCNDAIAMIAEKHDDSSRKQTQPARASLMAAQKAVNKSDTLTVVTKDFSPVGAADMGMLTLRKGEHVVAIGQDGYGWWFGRKEECGTEGWFPPAYVALAAA
eukprot:GEMP01044333.1.p1 GENE.GEMP01044333.1~~GEMP01044333.1.p1  ORF type:complete len:398 (+),score=107.21 GEMP01044333.1:211-1404(+)